ncbi:MAG: PPC domain-containing DNA-binding protein [Chloroflexota bacterium]
MKYWEEQSRGLVVLSLHHGDDVLECVQRAIREVDLDDAVVMTGVGSLQAARIHVIASNNYPPGDTFFDLEGPLEVAQIAGIIGGGVPHLHTTLFDAKHRAWGGHVEPGCRVLTLCELSIQRLTEVRMTRRALDSSGVKVLDPA